MIIKSIKYFPEVTDNKHKVIYVRYKQTIYGYSVYRKCLFISWYTVLDFNYRMKELKNSNGYYSN